MYCRLDVFVIHLQSTASICSFVKSFSCNAISWHLPAALLMRPNDAAYCFMLRNHFKATDAKLSLLGKISFNASTAVRPVS